MALLSFSDILVKAGLDPKRVKLIRHALSDKDFKACYRTSNASSNSLTRSPPSQLKPCFS